MKLPPLYYQFKVSARNDWRWYFSTIRDALKSIDRGRFDVERRMAFYDHGHDEAQRGLVHKLTGLAVALHGDADDAP